MGPLQQIVDNLSTEDKPYVIGSFLDSIRHLYNKGELKQDYFDKEPVWNDNIPIRTRAAFAGYCHSLCHEFEFDVPKWVFKSEYYLKDPYFANDAKGMLRVALLVESPNEFASRNIYFSENCMQRA